MIGPFDRALLRWRRDRSATNFSSHDFLFREVGARLAERLEDVKRTFPVCLELGARDGRLVDLLGGVGSSLHICSDLSFASLVRAGDARARIVADEEILPFAPGSVDLVFSVLALHWVNDLPGALARIRSILRPDGLLLGALFGGETLGELRECLAEAELEYSGGASPRISPFASLRDLGGLLLRAGFALPAADVDRIVVTYADPMELLRDLRGMGESNAVLERSRRWVGRGMMARARQIYSERYGTGNGRVRATFEILYLTGWAPHGSQSVPLRPGTGRVSLASALGGTEHGAGEATAPGRILPKARKNGGE